MGMFTPAIVPGACVPQLMRNEPNARFQLNAIPIASFNDQFVTGLSGFEIYFPRPFQILGICNSPLGNVPAPDIVNPKWPMIYPSPASPAIQDTYKDMSLLLMLELALASMRPYDPTAAYPVEYIRPGKTIDGPNNVDYRGYFTKFLNDELSAIPEQWLNTFIFPVSQFKSFAANNNAATQAQWEHDYRQLLTFLEKTSDQRLYGVPGLYRLQETPSDWVFFQDNEYFFFLEA